MLIKCFLLEETGKTRRKECTNAESEVVGYSETPIYRRADTGEEMQLRDAPAGAMYFADYYDPIWTPQLAHVLVVILPNLNHWVIDSQSSNCTIPDDRRQEQHHCWVINGELPRITVSKFGGPSCRAGAGSILMGGWHGFLRNGYLEEC